MGTLTARLVQARALGGGLARLALDALLPPLCLSCRAMVDAPGRLCADCWSEVRFLAGPCCAACGFPFAYDLGPGALCASCVQVLPLYGRARAVMRYDEASRGLLLGFKHADRTEAAVPFGRWMARAGAELLADADLILPVPLHRWRLWRRRYNQSALLAQAVGRESGVRVDLGCLERVRATQGQGGLSPAQRRDNVQGAFRVRPGTEGRLAGRRLLLVDDVLTTGATVEACARALLRAGAGAVDVLALARVAGPRPGTI